MPFTLRLRTSDSAISSTDSLAVPSRFPSTNQSWTVLKFPVAPS